MTDDVDSRVGDTLSVLKSRSACVLVTGANGFIGRALCEALTAAQIPCVAFDRVFDVTPDSGDGCRLTGDITDAAAVEALFARQPITHVVHGGGISGPAVAPANPRLIHAVNTVGTLNLLDAAVRHGVSRFIQLSSIAVYGHHPTRVPVAEDAALLAADYYGASKVAAEKIALSYRHNAGLGVVALRLASVYGPGRRVPCVVGRLFASMESGRPVTVSGPASNPRQLIHINDCLNAILLSLSTPKIPLFVYNIAAGYCVSESEVAAEAAAIDSRVRFEVSDTEEFFDNHIGPLRTEAARRDLGFDARTGLRDGLRAYWRIRLHEQACGNDTHAMRARL
jgi:UDP-glucuronate 4-epimerase